MINLLQGSASTKMWTRKVNKLIVSKAMPVLLQGQKVRLTEQNKKPRRYPCIYKTELAQPIRGDESFKK